jgi:EpsD family peptidyl-prolyl cis-trans isomerase
MINRNLLPLFVALACAASPSNAAPQAAKKTVASGQTQVVANVGGREVTLSELRMEMGRIGLSASDPNAERLALESLTNRILLSKAARTADLHRKPDVMARMYAAQDQALADYYLALATRPAEPTREEIDDFIKENPSLFADRKLYDFLVFTLETKNFNESALTPLFDREADFSRLAAVMTKAGARYSIAPAMQSGAAFPAPMRTQLGKYSARDNIVIKGDTETQIMKIVAVKNDVADQAGWPELALRSLIEMDAAKRAEALIARLRKETDVAYFRATSAPASPVKAE